MNLRTQYGVVAVCFSMLFSMVAAGEDPKVYQCAVRLLLNPKETANDGYATATFVKVNDGETPQYYVVTAYHNLHGKESCKLLSPGNPSWHLEDASDDGSWIFGPSFYVLRDYDIAVIPLKEAFGNAALVPFIELYKAQGDLTDVPEGANASAFGNPQVQFDRITFDPTNIGYRCTISEYAPAKNRVPLLENSVSGDVQLMFVETLSISPGFSGGPVIVSSDQFATGTLAGIVVGGVTKVEKGRFAFACPTSVISQGIRDYHEHAADAQQTFARGIVVHRIPGTRGSILRLKLTDYPSWDTPIQIDRALGYATRNAKVIDLRDRLDPRISDEQLKLLLRESRGRALVFINASFDGTDFAGAYLPNVTFRNCDFYNVKFKNSVIPGATFHSCFFSPPPPKGSEEFLFRGAYLSYGTVSILRSEENKTGDPLLKVESVSEAGRTDVLRQEAADRLTQALANLEVASDAIKLSVAPESDAPTAPSTAPTIRSAPEPPSPSRAQAKVVDDQLFQNFLNSPLPYRTPQRR